MQKIPNHTILQHNTLNTYKHTISNSLSFPFRGSFHLSLTILIHYQSMGNIQTWRKIPPNSRRITRVLQYSNTHYAPSRFTYQTITISNLPFQTIQLSLGMRYRGPYNPHHTTTSGLTFSPFAHRY